MGFALSDMELLSPAFRQQGNIPRKYTGEGDDVSPPLAPCVRISVASNFQ